MSVCPSAWLAVCGAPVVAWLAYAASTFGVVGVESLVDQCLACVGVVVCGGGDGDALPAVVVAVVSGAYADRVAVEDLCPEVVVASAVVSAL